MYQPKADGSGLANFDLPSYLKKRRKVMSLSHPLELEVVVGASLKLALRVIVTKLPKEAQVGRTKRLKNKSKTSGSGHKYTKKHLAYAHYKIYLTNEKVERGGSGGNVLGGMADRIDVQAPVVKAVSVKLNP